MNCTSAMFTCDKTEDYITMKKPLISDALYIFIMFISLGIVCQIIALFGTVSNIINIIIFVKQGFSDYINICLLALAVSDLLSLLFIIWSNLCFTPVFANSDVHFVTYEVQLISGTWPHATFTRTTGWLTAFINFERCLCVALPMKVKTIFTPRRHVIAVSTIFLVTVGCCFSLGYITIGLGWKFYPHRNQSLIGLVPIGDANFKTIVILMSYTINGVFIPMSAFVVVVVCTAVLVLKLHQHATWRHTISTHGSREKDNVLALRDKKAAKMVVLISVIFISCFVPAVGIFIAGYAQPQFSYDGLYKNLFLVTFSVTFTAEVINSSINIFVYITMSTKYRDTFRCMFRRMW